MKITEVTPNRPWYERTMPPAVIKYYIRDDTLIKEFRNIMDETGDEMIHNTNLRCEMTEYKSQLKPKYKKPFEIFIGIIDDILRTNDLSGLSVKDIWCAKYSSGDYAKPHCHSPAAWSFCYYLNQWVDFPTLELDGWGSIEPDYGLLVFFPGWVVHEVKKKEWHYSKDRYVVAGNIER